MHRAITPELMQSLNTGWSGVFMQGFATAETHYRDIAMVTKSNTAETGYPFLGQMPQLREWLGERRLKTLQIHGFAIKNRKFEDTIVVERTAIEDDVCGVYTPMFRELGDEAARMPDRLCFELLKAGFTTPSYDGQNFFDLEHPTKNEAGEEVPVANFQEGDGPAWYLLDTSRSIRPIIFQERIPFDKLTRVDADDHPHVFTRDQFVYGIRGRANAGYGLWQLAYASKAPLTLENYELARATMRGLRGDEATLMGVKPTTLVVPTQLEGAGRRVAVSTTRENGATNEWAGSVKLIDTHWLG